MVITVTSKTLHKTSLYLKKVSECPWVENDAERKVTIDRYLLAGMWFQQKKTLISADLSVMASFRGEL